MCIAYRRAALCQEALRELPLGLAGVLSQRSSQSVLGDVSQMYRLTSAVLAGLVIAREVLYSPIEV